MENFLVSARKYRPSTFSSVVGQQHITGTLKNAIKSGHLAQAFLFCGPRGVGKTSCARILAKTINCQVISSDAEACGRCDSCLSFAAGNTLNIYELDAASNNSVDDIRSLVEQVRYLPQAGKYKVYIIDEVHMLSNQAFNAFLKTLEEPPSYAIFILATTEKHKIIPTILSRCQLFEFNRIKVTDMASYLAGIAKQENIRYQEEALHLIAQKADGALRDACSMFDQISAFSQDHITYEAVTENLHILDAGYYFKVTAALLAEDAPAVLLLFDAILTKGFDGNDFVMGLCLHFRNLLVAQDAQTIHLLEASEGIKQQYLAQASKASAAFLLSGLSIGNTCDLQYKSSNNARLLVELTLLKMCHLEAALDLSKEHAPLAAVSKKKSATPKIEAKEHASQSFAETSKPVQIASDLISSDIKPKSLRNLAAQSGIPSLNAAHHPKVQQETKTTNAILTAKQATQNQKFTHEQLMIHWRSYSQKAKEEGRMNLHNLLVTHDPVLVSDVQITHTVNNVLLKDAFVAERTALLRFLRTQLKNDGIQIKVSVAETARHKNLPESMDQYQRMLIKNPHLQTLREHLDLDLEV